MQEDMEITKFDNSFQFNNKPLRFSEIEDVPWFVAADVCKLLEISNASAAVSRLEDYEKGITTVNTIKGKQRVLCVNESGLYSLTLTSRKHEAKEFKKWVTTEVLPSIRKTGKYEITSNSNSLVLVGDQQITNEQFQKIIQFFRQIVRDEIEASPLLIETREDVEEIKQRSEIIEKKVEANSPKTLIRQTLGKANIKDLK